MAEKKPYFNPDLIKDTVNNILLEHGLNVLQRTASTNGGEWHSPCPHCIKVGNVRGNKNEDRLMVWPNRPVFGGAMVFYCRHCGGDGVFSQKWTGDLLQFVGDMRDMSFPEALDFLEIPEEYRDMSTGPQNYAPRHRPTVQRAPSELYQNKCLELLEIAESNLWGNRGGKRLDQLRYGRGLSDDVIQFARLGFNPQKQFFDSAEFGLEEEGKIILDRGFVIPDFQYDFKLEKKVLWSLMVRRLPEDIKMDILDGKPGHKYSVVRGGVRGLYMSYTLLPHNFGQKRPHALCSGPFDALATLTATKFQYAASATQTDKGAQYPQWIHFIKDYAPFTLIVSDNDESGKQLAQFWTEALGDDAMACRLKSFKDPCEMHANGNDLHAFLDQQRKKYARIWNIKRQQYARPEPRQEVEEVVKPVNVPFEEESAQNVKIEPVLTISAKDHNSISNTGIDKCIKCGQPCVYTDDLGWKWCVACFACVQLINFGNKNGFQAFDFPAGYGLIAPAQVTMENILNQRQIEDDPNAGFKYSEGGRVQRTRTGYKNFCYDAPPEMIWLAARHVFRLLHGYKPEQEEESGKMLVQYPCANKNCKRDRKRPQYPEGEPYTDRWGKKHWPGDKEGPAFYGVTTWPGTPDQLEWCPRCSGNHQFLLLCEQLGYPGLQRYTAYPLDPGKEAAIEYARTQSAFAITNAHDLLLFERKPKSA